MKKISVLTILCIFIFTNTVYVQASTGDEKETRAVWVTSVYNQDWPSQSSQNNPELQKQEFIKILDDVKSLGLNTVMLQVRPKGDALYKSNINPWSDVLTGTQGKDPGYDPLKFAIDEAHKRGIELHAWFNPYRVTTSGTDLNKLSPNNFARKNPGTVIQYKDALVYNPGLPEVKKHIADTVAEVVSNYDVDGIHFDDYFYPGNDINDNDAYNRYGNGMNRDDFRRNNVNEMVRNVYNTIKSINSSVQFGISPRGIWKNKSSDSTGSDTNGAQSYYDIYADTRTWIKNGWLDYVIPQIYWEIGNKAADYSKLISWWANEVNNTNVQLYIGQGIYKPTVAREIDSQIALNRKYSNIKGNAYFAYRDIRNNTEGVREKILKANNDYDGQLPDNTIAGVVYKTHVQDYGWQAWKYNGETSGTSGQAKRLESIQIKVNGLPAGSNILYRTHIQDYGWQDWKSNGQSSGTIGKSKRIEAMEIKLQGAPD
ncbi:MAG: family 10 glycosylhydrolase, partial [Clostridium sp.]